MKKTMILSLVAMVFGTVSYGQDLDQAKKAIDAEQYEKAKTILKGLIQNKSDDGKNYFFLGDVYLTLSQSDSATTIFQKGITVKNNANWNYIGLGQIDLNNNNAAAADANFNLAIKNLKKRDYLEYMYIGKAYTNSDNPNYQKAVASLNKAKAINPNDAEVFIAIGDAYHKAKNNNEAYVAYRNALDVDNSVLRAQIQMAVITKNARAFPEAVKDFNTIQSKNPNYGPVYRELAETYYLWANHDRKKYDEYTKKALDYYSKYMTLTDFSLDSRMRYADFLILSKDYKMLEVEANKMAQVDKVNPRILRYLGYSAYENGNYEASIKALQDFIEKVESKRVIGKDYLYLGLAKIAQASKEEGEINTELFNQAVADIQKAADVDIEVTNELNAIGLKLFKEKKYTEASKIFEVAVLNPKSQNFLYDNFYLGYALYFEYASQTGGEAEPDKTLLEKADVAFSKVIEASPTTQDAHLYRARVNRLLDSTESRQLMVTHYEEYIKVVTDKGADELAKAKVNVIEAYSYIGAYYGISDKAKAIENFEKALALDPNDKYVIDSLKALR